MKTDTLKSSSLSTFGTSLFTAFFIFILEIIFVLAFTALMYSGELSSQIPRAVGFIIFGDAILCGIAAYFSSNPGAIGVEQDAPGAMLAVITAGIIATLSGAAAEQFATVTLMIVSTTLLTGVLLLVLGYFKLGGIVRFLPYPVIGGFLAGSGWLLVQGGIGVMTNIPIGLSWFKAHTVMLWLPGVFLGIISRVVSQKVKKPYAIPLLMLLASLTFYLIVWMTNLTLSDLRATGWLLDSYASASRWEFPLAPAFLSQVDWSVLLSYLPAMVPIAMISAIGLLLNSSGMELLVKKDIDLNRELMVAGLGNVFAGLAGGLAGFQDVSFSTLNQVMSGGKRLVGILTAMMIAATLFVGTSAILYIPKFVFGAVLIYLGIELLMDWVYEAWFKFSRIDFLVIVTILVVLAVSGVLQGVIAGLILAVALFTVSYSRISVTRHELSGADLQSRFTRSHNQKKALIEQGDKSFILQLQGFIFFGTANKLLEQVRSRVEQPNLAQLQFLVLDFAKVSGLDSTAMLSFAKMKQILQDRNITILVTGPSAEILNQLEKGEFISENSATSYPDLDHGLEWMENQILNTGDEQYEQNIDLKDMFQQLLPNKTHLNDLFNFLEKREVKTGDYLMRQGDAPDNIYFVENGQVTAQLEFPNQSPVRLETMKSGRVIGELGFYLGQKRTAAVVADETSTVYLLSAQNLAKMEKKSPEVASYFHQLIIHLLAERTTHLIRAVSALEK